MRYSQQRSVSHANSMAVGCLQLLARIGFVAYAITKIVMGAKYRSDCPVQELVPISTILSGCFQFLLFAMPCERNEGSQPEARRDPRGHTDTEVEEGREAFMRKCRFVTCSLAAALNVTAWILGTVAVSNALVMVKFTNHTCPEPEGTATEVFHKNLSLSQGYTSIAETATGTHTNLSMALHANQSTDLHLNQSGELHVNHSTDLHLNQSGELHVNHSTDLHLNQSGELHVNHSTELHANQSTELHDVTKNHSTEQHTNHSTLSITMNSANVTGENNTDTSEDVDDRGSALCISCQDTIFMFVAVAVIIDWLIGISGALFICYLRFQANKHRYKATVT